MSSAKLKHAPLNEVVFEIQWEGKVDNAGILSDDGFDIAQGKLDEKLKPEYPLRKKLIPDGAAFRTFGIPVYQYWKGEFKWPVIQHGQCIFTVNEVEAGYEWENSYKPTVLTAIELLAASYEEPLKFNRLKLQYIDAWDVEGLEAIDFMRLNLQTNIETKYKLPGKLSGFNVSQGFDLADGSVMHLSISNGTNIKSAKPTIIWTTTVEKFNRFNADDILPWLEHAHASSSEMFKQMLDPDFYAELDR